MTPNSPQNVQNTQQVADDNLDRLLSDFFKSRMIQPWPAAPTPAASEPSVLVAARAATDAPRNQPVATRDPNSRARYTLAASVALLLGTCWYLSSGLQPGMRSGNGSGHPRMIPDAGANQPEVLKTLREENAIKGADGKARPKIEMP